METVASKLKWSKDGLVCFNPERHCYHYGEKRLEGVTTFISRYKQFFDKEVQAEKYALKHGLIASEVLTEWEAKGLKARNEGTAVHDVLETYCTTGELKWEKGVMKQIVAVKFIKDYFMSGKLEPVESEMIVYGDNVASMIDLVARNPKGEYFILDYKTSKEISRNGYGKSMHPPFHIHPDASYYHYSLQVSIYKQLCTYFDIKDCFIVHFSETDYEIIRALDIKAPKHLL